ncbi:hypothetical protein WMZ97_19855 [Lentibacillus sp. N15]
MTFLYEERNIDFAAEKPPAKVKNDDFCSIDNHYHECYNFNAVERIQQ